MAHHEPPHQDLRCLQIQLFSSLVVKELNKLLTGIRDHIDYYHKRWVTELIWIFFNKLDQSLLTLMCLLSNVAKKKIPMSINSLLLGNSKVLSEINTSVT